jgi:hypothetical protein
MVTVDAVEHFDAHAEKACDLPAIDAGLQQPTRCRVPQRVWRDLPRQLCQRHGAFDAAGRYFPL